MLIFYVQSMSIVLERFWTLVLPFIIQKEPGVFFSFVQKTLTPFGFGAGKWRKGFPTTRLVVACASL